jgi:Mn-containing catalase
MPTGRGKDALTDIGTEKLAHWEMIATMIFKLTQGGGLRRALRHLGQRNRVDKPSLNSECPTIIRQLLRGWRSRNSGGELLETSGRTT